MINIIQGNMSLAVCLALGGLGIFLISIKLLSSQLKKSSSTTLSKVLKKFTSNDYVSILFGILFTTMIQSSDGAVALVIALVAAGFMPLRSAFAFVLGANIGTASTSIIVALSDSAKFVQYFMIFAVIGALGVMVIKDGKTQDAFLIMAFVGIMFSGLKVMGWGFKSVANAQIFKNITNVVGKNEWSSTGFSFIMTGLMQSSSASVTVGQHVFVNGGMPLTGAIGFVVGANIGTTITAFITTIGQPKDTKRIALFWFFTNIITSIIVLPLTSAGYYGFILEKMNIGKAWEMAVSHLLYNSLLVIIFMWQLKWITKLMYLIIKKDIELEMNYEIKFSKQLIKENSSIALESLEISYITYSKIIDDILNSIKKLINTNNPKYKLRFDKLRMVEAETRNIIFDYSTELSMNETNEHSSAQILKINSAIRNQQRVVSLANDSLDLLQINYKKNKIFKKEKTKSFYISNPKMKVSKNKIQKIYKYKFILNESEKSEILQLIKLTRKIGKLASKQSKEFSIEEHSAIKHLFLDVVDFSDVINENNEKRIENKENSNKDFNIGGIASNFSRIANHQYLSSKAFKHRSNNRLQSKEEVSVILQNILNSEIED
ncbi:MAG: Na/Pi symporter [Mollicutes bacterium PWAP]|nr:Na/Pi symporter [Mollicutes bacterium PWAP]